VNEWWSKHESWPVTMPFTRLFRIVGRSVSLSRIRPIGSAH